MCSYVTDDDDIPVTDDNYVTDDDDNPVTDDKNSVSGKQSRLSSILPSDSVPLLQVSKDDNHYIVNVNIAYLAINFHEKCTFSSLNSGI